MIVIKPSRKIRINDPTRATYSRLDIAAHQLLFVQSKRDSQILAVQSLPTRIVSQGMVHGPWLLSFT